MDDDDDDITQPLIVWFR